MRQHAKNNCPACLSEKVVELGIKNDFLLECCNLCRTIFTRKNLGSKEITEEITELYDHYYDAANFKILPATEISLQKAMDSFENFRQTGKLLDIGYGEGGLLTVAEKNGWQCFGTELSPQAIEHGAAKGWTVTNDASADSRFRENEFDVVTMIELIEHVLNPDDFFRTAFSMLRPGGLLYMTTPNQKSINQRLLGADWSIVSPPEHITIWSPLGIKKILQRNNFTVHEMRTEGFNPVEILARLKTKKDDSVPVSRNEAAFALNETFSSSPLRRAVKIVINRGLSTFRLGDGIKVWAVKTKNV